MLLNIKMPRTYHKELNRASLFVIALLNYCDKKGIAPVQFDFTIFLTEYPRFQLCQLAKFTNLTYIRRINEFWRACPGKATRAQVVEALYRDLRFIRSAREPGLLAAFYFQSADFSSVAQCDAGKLKILFQKFYPAFFDQKNSKMRQSYKKDYQTSNPDNFYICPACLGELNLDRAQLDHYFPKSQYLGLVVHPYNLVPLCISCNTVTGGGKGDRIPTDPAATGSGNRPGCLEDAYLPYYSFGLGQVKMNVAGQPGQRSAQLTAMRAADRKKIANHAATYDLERVWTSRLQNAYNTMIHKLMDEFRYQHGTGQPISVAEVKSHLTDSIIRYSESKSERIENYFILANYAVWLLNDGMAMQALVQELESRLFDESRKAGPASSDGLPYFMDVPDP